jgi:methyltransferase-like protein/trans-aconitate methyltransferase
MASPEKYNAFNYPSAPFDYSHCRRLETVAKLFGMQPAPITSARVLELGCGDGSNLIPQAENFPQATFLGIDYARVPIEQGQALIDAVGLSNIQLRAENVMDLDPACGRFDYVIAHGLYSWIPPEVQARTLELLPQLLAEQGVAFVSYNTLPGWHLKRTVRDLMLDHTARIDQPEEKVEQAMAILQWLTSAAREGTPYREYLESELKLLDSKPAGYVYHDHLEDQNEALYFRDFLGRAAAQGLQYLGEAEIAYMFWHDIPPKQQQDLARLPVEVAEQLMDFIRNRAFRKTLLCQGNVELDRQPSAALLETLHFGLENKADLHGLDLHSAKPLQLQIGGNTLQIAEPLLQAALAELCEAFPASSSVPALSKRACERLRAAGVESPHSAEQAQAEICQFLWMFGSAGVFEVYLHPPSMCTEVSEHPRISPLVRYHAEHERYTTNRKHVWVELDEVSRRMIGLLDGTHTRAEVLEQIATEIRSGALPSPDGAADSPEAAARQALDNLAQCCLLIA